MVFLERPNRPALNVGDPLLPDILDREIERRDRMMPRKIHSHSGASRNNAIGLRCPEDDEAYGIIQDFSANLLAIPGVEFSRCESTGGPVGVVKSRQRFRFLRRWKQKGGMTVKFAPRQKDRKRSPGHRLTGRREISWKGQRRYGSDLSNLKQPFLRWSSDGPWTNWRGGGLQVASWSS